MSALFDRARGIVHGRLLPELRGMRDRARGVGWSAPHPSWASASAASTGYALAEIVERSLRAQLAVRAGRGVFERDTVLFTSPEYRWPLVAALHYAARKHDGIDVVDVGGALGSTLTQHRRLFAGVRLRWSVVEQPLYVEAGRQLEDETLRFYDSLAACAAHERPTIALFSSVLQYLEDPWAVLREAAALPHVDHIVLDRIAFSRTGRDRVTVQTVPPDIYTASYPCRFLAEEGVHRALADFDVVARLPCDEPRCAHGSFSGFLYERRAPR